VRDGAYAAVPLIQRCQRLKCVKLASRLRLDAGLHDFSGSQPKSKQGPKPNKGERQPNLAARLADPETQWQPVQIPWRGLMKPLSDQRPVRLAYSVDRGEVKVDCATTWPISLIQW